MNFNRIITLFSCLIVVGMVVYVIINLGPELKGEFSIFNVFLIYLAAIFLQFAISQVVTFSRNAKFIFIFCNITIMVFILLFAIHLPLQLFIPLLLVFLSLTAFLYAFFRIEG